MGLSKVEEKNYAQILYTRDNLTAKEVAERVGVTQKTIGKWIKDENWDRLKRSLLITKKQQIALFYDQLAAINQMIAERDKKYPNPQEANTITQITSSIQKLETETSIGQVVEVARAFIEFVREFDLDFAKKVTQHFDAFIQMKMK